MADNEPGADDKSERDDPFQALKGLPCTVDSVNIYPPDIQTRLLLILREFKTAKKSETFEDVVMHTGNALEALKDLGVFREVEAKLAPGLPSNPGTCNVELNLSELKWYSFHIGSQVCQDGRIIGQATGRARNLTGNCEHHSLSIEHGGHNRKDLDTELAYRLRFARMYGFPVHFQTTVHQSHQICQKESSYSEKLRGINLDLLTSDGCGRFGWEFSWLQLSDRSRHNASKEVLQDFGDHVKSALHYSYTQDHRRSVGDAGIAHAGTAIRFSSEVSGLNPEFSPLQFVKARLDCQHASALSDTTTFTLDSAMGLMLPIAGCWKEQKETMIRERFFLGGVSSLRGFEHKGVGARAPCRKMAGGEDAGSDAIGGDLFASVRAAVNFALPGDLLKQVGARGHLFADTGSVTQLSGKVPAQTRLDSFWNEWRLAVGLGVKVPFSHFGYLEVNYVQTLGHYGQDRVQQGLQFGLSSDPYVTVPPSAM